jgi:para-nitrobenzyl esterase
MFTNSPPIVHTSAGLVAGNASVAGACASVFFGIPYAAAPTGSRRWRPPQPPVPWADVRDAQLDNHPKCMQTPDAGALDLPDWIERPLENVSGWEKGHSEDCLFINVQTPSRLPSQRSLPVVVSIHGGSYLAGSGSGTNASQICAAGIVYVSFNYRLGVFGALALPELLTESSTTGNYALQDQRAALQWVHENIGAFGGDPSRVTLSGESAGAMSIAAHLASRRSAPYFAQAIVMSGNDDSLLLGEGTSAGMRFAEHVGCGGSGVTQQTERLRCLRAADAWKLVNLQAPIYNGTMRTLQLPLADGYELPKGTLLSSVYEDGAGLPEPAKPLLAGSNTDDISLFLGFTLPEVLRNLAGGPLETTRSMMAALPRLVPNATALDLAHLMELYSPRERYGGDARRAMYDLTTDGYYACPTIRMLNATASRGAPSYGYVFNGTIADVAAALGLPASTRPLLERYVSPWLGAFHGANEILFWSHDDPDLDLAAKERALGRRLVQRWTSFVHTGAPDSGAWRPWAGRESQPQAVHAGLESAIGGAGRGGVGAVRTSVRERPEDANYMLFDLHGDRLGSGWHRKGCDSLRAYRFIWNPPA